MDTSRLRPIFLFLVTFLFLLPAFALNRFTDNKDGTIHDNTTGLTWIKNPEDLPELRGGMIWINAKNACEDLVYEGVGPAVWHLPDIKELQSILSDSGSPRIDSIFNSLPVNYWSSTDYSGPGANAWLVNFANGQLEVRRKLNLLNPELHRARCVHE